MHNVDQILAMLWIQTIWLELESSIIQNFWAETGLIGV